jgi:diguanylate cyclase (GGDEF)-like protein/PAS domain S-box-containing protein
MTILASLRLYGISTILSSALRVFILPAAVLLALSLCGNAWAGNVIDSWRGEAATARMLAENNAPAAYQKVQHLQLTIPAQATPNDRTLILNLLARIETYLALTDTAAAHAQQAYALAKQHADKVGQAEADLTIAINAINQGKLDVMTAATIDSLEMLDGVDRPDLLSEALLRTSMMYQRQGQFDDAITTSLQAMDIAKRSNNPLALAYAHHGLAFSFDQNGQEKEAINHYIKMREQAHAAHMLRIEADAVLGYGRVTGTDLVNGERLIREATAMYRKIGTPYSVAFSLIALATNQDKQGLTANSMLTLAEAVNIFEKYPNKIGMWWVLNIRSKYAQSLGQTNAARADAERAYALALSMGFSNYISASARSMAALIAEDGDYKHAYQRLSEADAMSAQTAKESASTRILELTKRYQSESKQRQIDALNLRSERQTSELKQHELHQRWLITLAAGSLIVLFVTVPLLMHVRRSNRMLKYEANERMRIDEALMISERQFRTLVENTYDHIARYDRNCHCIYANPKMVSDSGLTLAQLLKRKPTEVSNGDSYLAYEEVLQKILTTAKSAEYELTTTLTDGRPSVRLIQLTPEFDQVDNVVSVLAVGRDITEIDIYRKQVHNLAFFDTLTHLPNRALLSDRIQQAVADAARRDYQFGLMMMDLDHFKEINDTLGHSVGDQVLLEAAERVQNCVRSHDTVARLGGDEFAILLPGIRSDLDLDVIAYKILFAFKHPFVVDGRELFISSSIGISIYPDDSTDVETLFRYADSAMYHAKQQGRNNFQFYSTDLTEKASGRMSVENDLRKAQERNELELYYQPQVELASGKIIGAEALLRWNHSQKGIITPDKFISVAEETGLIVGIGEWVFRSACQAAVTWNANRVIPLRIAVNLSTRQFIRNNLVSTIQRTLTETACQPSWIKLEITESLLLEDSTEIAAMLNNFNKMGLAISIDDFGTGYSALSYLNRFPVSQIKIDRSFVKDIPHDHEKTELVKVMISISQVLDMELVAEGVETQEQADCLLTNGCVVGQGYLFGKPMPYTTFETLI